MTMLLENRTISMLLTVPEIKEPISATSYSVENLEQTSFAALKNQKPSAIPIYHGSIIRIEQHNDIDNTSDLIVRVPNFHHLSLPSLNISNLPSHDIQSNNLDSQRESRPKRRAPICPILHDLQHRFPSKNRSQSEIHSRLINTKRLAIGLRNLSRVITTTCKSKQASSVNTRPFIPALPDVEVITENFQKPTITKKTAKHENSTSKFFTPKFLFIKRKHFRTKKQQTTLKPIDIENSNKHSTIDESSTKINVKDVESEQPKEATSTTIPIQITTDAEPKTETIEKLIPNIPIFAIDPESTSTHRYCTIPRSPSDPHTVITDDTVSSMDLSRSIFQSNTSISKEKNDSTTGVEILININNTQTQDYNENIEDRIHVVHPNGDTYSEYYEVTYELDPECQNIIHDEKSIQLSLDPVKYDELSKVVSTWLPSLPDDTPSHNYDEVEDHNINESYEKTRENLNITSLEISPKITRVKFQSLEDTSQISNDPSTIYQPESASACSSSPENDLILYFDDSTLITEDYTVILQLLRNVLQIDINNTNNDDEDDGDNNNQLDQDFQKNTIDQLEQK